MKSNSIGKSKKKKSSFVILRLFIFTLVFFSFVSILGYNFVNNLLKLKELYNLKNDLQNQIVALADEKENLESDVERLSDSTYIAKYAREKYFYSKSGELIIRLDDDE